MSTETFYFHLKLLEILRLKVGYPYLVNQFNSDLADFIIATL